MVMTPEDRFWNKVAKGAAHECWEWTGSKLPSGYGQFRGDGNPGYAHRYSYEIHYSPPGDGVVRHICDNPSCVNPRHLRLGTQKENLADMYAKGRGNKAFGENAGNAVLTEAEVAAIFMDSRSIKDIASVHRVGETAIRKIKKGETWRQLTRHLLPASERFNMEPGYTGASLPRYTDDQKELYNHIYSTLEEICNLSAEMGHLMDTFKVDVTHPESGQKIVYDITIKGYVKQAAATGA